MLKHWQVLDMSLGSSLSMMMRTSARTADSVRICIVHSVSHVDSIKDDWNLRMSETIVNIGDVNIVISVWVNAPGGPGSMVRIDGGRRGAGAEHWDDGVRQSKGMVGGVGEHGRCARTLWQWTRRKSGIDAHGAVSGFLADQQIGALAHICLTAK